MWLIIPEGFFSIVIGDAEFPDSEGKLQVRARDPQDLDRLRNQVPDLGPTVMTPDGDYQCRAFISREEFAMGLGDIGAGIDYRNLKSAVGRVDANRARLYGRVWEVLLAVGSRVSRPGW